MSSHPTILPNGSGLLRLHTKMQNLLAVETGVFKGIFYRIADEMTFKR